jgi:hypothetical protein
LKLTQLSSDEFDRLANMTRLRDSAKEMAREVLVGRRNKADVGRAFGVTRQRVGLAVGSIEEAYRRSVSPSNATIRVTLELPDELASALGSLIAAIRSCDDQELLDAELDKVGKSIQKATRSLETGKTS